MSIKKTLFQVAWIMNNCYKSKGGTSFINNVINIALQKMKLCNLVPLTIDEEKI